MLSFLAAIPVSSAVAPSPFLDSEKFSFDQPLECPRQPRRTVPRIEESAQTAAIYEYRADRQSLSLHHVLYFTTRKYRKRYGMSPFSGESTPYLFRCSGNYRFSWRRYPANVLAFCNRRSKLMGKREDKAQIRQAGQSPVYGRRSMRSK